MAKYLPLPNGDSLKVPDDMTYEEAMAKAQTRFPQLFAEATPAEPPKARFSGADTMRAVGQGALGGIKALTDVFGAGNAASNMLEAGTTRLQEGMTAGRKAEMERQAQRMREAEASGDVKREAMAGLENFLEAPVQATAQGLGSIAPFAATSIAGAAAKLLPATIRVLQTAMGAGMGAGAVKGSIYEAVYKQNIEDGRTPAEAHQQAQTAQEYVGKNTEQIALGSGLGAVAARIGAEKLLVPGAEKGLAASMARRVGKAVAEEVPLEAAQGGQERLAANVALQREGVDTPTFRGVAGQAVQEGLTAGMAAAPIAAYRSPRAGMEAAARAEEAKRIETAAAEQQAALEAKRADPNYLNDLLAQSADYQAKLKALDETMQAAKPAKGETADPVAIAAARNARETKDALLRSDEYEAHQADLQEAAPALQEMRAAQAKAQAEQTAAAAAEREAKLADPVLQEQLHGQFQGLSGQLADTRNQIDAAIRGGDTATAAALTTQFTELDTQRKALQEQLGPRPTAAGAATPEAMQAELARLVGTTARNGSPKAGEIMKLFDAGDIAGAQALMKKADELRAAIAEPTRARDAVQRQIEAFKASQQPAPTVAPTPATPTPPPENLSPEAAKQWLLDRKEAARDAQRTPLNPDFTEQRTLPLTANPVQYTSAATTQRREQTLEGLKNEFGALVHSARTQRVNGKVDPVLQEQITAKADEIRDFQSAVARQGVPRGKATAEMAPELAGAQKPETLPPSQPIESVERTLTPEKTTEEAVRTQLGQLPDDLSPGDDALVAQITRELPALRNAGLPAETVNAPSIEGVPYDKVTADLAPTRALDDVAAYLYKLRTGNDASTEAAQVREHLARAEQGKRSETDIARGRTKIKQDLIDRSNAAYGTAEGANLSERAKGLPDNETQTTAVQEDMFADTELQGTIFNSYAEFEKYLAGDAVQEMRKNVGLTLATAARLQREIAPMEAKVAELRAYLSRLQEVQTFVISAGDASVAKAQAKHQAAVTALQDTIKALEAKLDPQRNALQQAMLDLYNAQAAQAKISDAIAKNTAKFNRDPGLQAAADKVSAAHDAHAAALKRAASTGKADPAEMTRLYQASVAAINEQRTLLEGYAKDSRKLQERSILAFLNRDLQLTLRLRDAEQTVDKARAAVDNARVVLDEAYTALQAAPETQQTLREAKQGVSTAQGVLTKARNRATNARVRDAEAVREVSDELQAAKAELAAAKKPVETAQRVRTLPPLEETKTQREEADAAVRKAQNERTERLAAIPGAKVSHTSVRAIMAEVERLPERIRALDAAAKDETASQAARNKAKYAAADMRERAKIMYGLISNDPALVEAASTALDTRIAEVEEKIGAKQAAVNEPGKAASTIRSRRKELSELRTDLNQLKRLRRLADNRATFAPVGTSKQSSTALADTLETVQDKIRSTEDPNVKAALQKQADGIQAELDKRDEAEQRLTLERGINLETEGTTGALPARTIGPLVKNAVQAGVIRTGDTSTTGERMAGSRNKPQQGGKKRGVTGVQAMKQSAKDVAHEQALLKLSELEDLQERNDAALKKARADKDAVKIAKYEGFAARLKEGIARAQKRVDETVSTAADVSVLDDTIAPVLYAPANDSFSWKDLTDAQREQWLAAANPAVRAKVARGGVPQSDFASFFAKIGPGEKVQDTTPTTVSTKAPDIKPETNDTQDRIDARVRWLETTQKNTMALDHPLHGATFAEAARWGAENTRSPIMRALFMKITDVLDKADSSGGGARVYVASKMGTAADGSPIRQHYHPTHDYVLVSASSNRFIPTLLHELMHAATNRGLHTNKMFNAHVQSLIDKVSSWLNTAEGKTYMRNNRMGLYSKDAVDASGYNRQVYGLKNTDEFMSELYSSRAFQKLLQQVPTETPVKSIFGKAIDAIARFLGVTSASVETVFGEAHLAAEEALRLNRELRMDKTWRTHAMQDAGEEVFNAPPKYETTSALGKMSDMITAKPSSPLQRLGHNPALSIEMAVADMRAPLIKALSFAGEKALNQATYYVRKADALMNHVYASLSSGPLELVKTSKGNFEVRAGNGPSMRVLLDAVRDVKGISPEDKMSKLQAYLASQRAERVGWGKLDFTNADELQKQAAAVKAELAADPSQKAALEKARKVYNEMNKGTVGFLASSGYISKAKAAELLQYGDYVPFYRVRADGIAELVMGEAAVIRVGDIRNNKFLSPLVGDDNKLLPLNEAIVRNTMLLTDMALKNLAAKDVAYALQKIGSASPVNGRNAMRIHSGQAPKGDDIIKFHQEPNPADESDKGERWMRIRTQGTALEHIPADMLAQSLEGTFSTLPAGLKAAAWFGDLLRSGVTRNPMYVVRQLIRDPLAATFTGGLESGIVKSVFKTLGNYVEETTGRSKEGEILMRKGLTQSGIFTGDIDDINKMMLQITKGDAGALQKTLAWWDKAAMSADAATRIQMYKDAKARGLDDMEAELAAMEMMNFNKRGSSPTVQYAARMIPFLNAQIQGLNVLAKAMTGNMPQNEKLAIKEKFYRRALTMALFTIGYAMAMEDDETYKTARPRDRYNNWILPNPTGGEAIKLPIPFEVGLLFKALPEALVDVMRGDFNDEEFKAIRQAFVAQIPGSSSYGLPQMIKPVIEVVTNHNFFTEREIESVADRGKDSVERFGSGTTELSKEMSKIINAAGIELSPKQMDHLISGYLGSVPIMVARLTNNVFASAESAARPTERASDSPIFGALFQRNLGGGPVDAAYAQEEALSQAKRTYDSMLSSGRKADAEAYKEDVLNVLGSPEMAKQFKSKIDLLQKADKAARNTIKDPDALRARLDELERKKHDAAKLYLDAVRQIAH